MEVRSRAVAALRDTRLRRASKALGRALGLAIKGPTWILVVTALVIPGSPPTLAAFPEKTESLLWPWLV